MRIAENVYAVMDLYHPIGVNAGFIVTKSHIVYVDSGHTIPSAQTIYGYSKAAAPENEPSYLILTDHHTDHIFGMKVFRNAGATTLGHKRLDRWMEEYLMPNFGKVIRTFGLDEKARDLIYGDVELFPLDETVDQDTTITIDGEEIEILTTPGHWEACLSVYIPSSRILFAGGHHLLRLQPNDPIRRRKAVEEMDKFSRKTLRTRHKDNRPRARANMHKRRDTQTHPLPRKSPGKGQALNTCINIPLKKRTVRFHLRPRPCFPNLRTK